MKTEKEQCPAECQTPQFPAFKQILSRSYQLEVEHNTLRPVKTLVRPTWWQLSINFSFFF